MHQYLLVTKIGEGAFSEVLKSQSLKSGNTVAIKCMKNQYTNIEQVQKLREIQALKKLSPHPHIVKLIEVLYDEPTGRLALVFELMDQNLYDCIKNRKSYLNPQKVKFYMYQVMKAVEHMHKNGIFHRDIKPENILLRGDHIKVADLGSCKGIHSTLPYTEYISTRWYRAPECLMTDGYYDQKMDLWGVGAVMFEIISLFPLFPGKNELDQVHKIHNILGTPDPKVLERFAKHASHMEFNFPARKGTGLEKLIPHASKDCIDLLYRMLTYDPIKRITAEECLQHEYFKEFQQMEQGPLNSTFSSLKLSPSSQLYRKSLEQTQAYDQIKGNNFSQTQKGILPINPYQQTQKKDKWTKKNKQPSMKNQGGSGYYPQQIKVDVKIEGFNHSGTDEDQPDSKAHQQLPPIKHLETKTNFNYTIKADKKTLASLNPYNQAPNPYYQSQYKPQAQKKPSKYTQIQQQGNDNYMIYGKKAAFN